MTIGINVHVPTTKQLELIAEIGIENLRIDVPSGMYIDKPKRFARLRDDLRRFKMRALVIPYLHDAKFLEHCVGSFADSGVLDSVAVWNEPNLARFWTFGIDAYIRRMRLVRSIVDRTAPGTPVVAGDLAHLKSAKWWEWLDPIAREATQNGTADVIGHHAYSSDGTAKDVARKMRSRCPLKRSVRRVLDRAGWSGPVWITETGIDTNERPQATQAAFVRDIAGALWDCERVYLYEAFDPGDDADTDERFGLAGPAPEYEPKLAWKVLGVVTFRDRFPEVTS